jgi:hypothetical protein
LGAPLRRPSAFFPVAILMQRLFSACSRNQKTILF